MTEKQIDQTRSQELENNPRLKVNLLGTKLSSPLILGSGTLVEKAEEIGSFLDAGAGAVVPRSTRKVMTRRVHPSPHLYQSGKRNNAMMLNAEWTGADIEYWKPHLPSITKDKRVIMSVSGRDVVGCVEVCEILDQFELPMIEINVSCAHSNDIHGFITRNGEHIRRVIGEVKDSGVKTPIGIKLGHSDYIVQLSQIAKEAGADAIVALNTFGPLFDFDIGQGGIARPVLGIKGAKGGMSGAPLFNIALTDVAEIRHQVGISVVGVGGVRTAEQVVKMIMAGASAVQIYTAAHVRGINAPSIFSEVNKQLISYLDKLGVEDIADLKDRALPLLSQETNLNPITPQVDEESCLGCGKCVSVCLHQAIKTDLLPGSKQNHILEIDKNTCVGCGHCVSVCPTESLKMEDIWK